MIHFRWALSRHCIVFAAVFVSLFVTSGNTRAQTLETGIPANNATLSLRKGDDVLRALVIGRPFSTAAKVAWVGDLGVAVPIGSVAFGEGEDPLESNEDPEPSSLRGGFSVLVLNEWKEWDDGAIERLTGQIEQDENWSKSYWDEVEKLRERYWRPEYELSKADLEWICVAGQTYPPQQSLSCKGEACSPLIKAYGKAEIGDVDHQLWKEMREYAAHEQKKILGLKNEQGSSTFLPFRSQAQFERALKAWEPRKATTEDDPLPKIVITRELLDFSLLGLSAGLSWKPETKRASNSPSFSKADVAWVRQWPSRLVHEKESCAVFVKKLIRRSRQNDYDGLISREARRVLTSGGNQNYFGLPYRTSSAWGVRFGAIAEHRRAAYVERNVLGSVQDVSLDDSGDSESFRRVKREMANLETFGGYLGIQGNYMPPTGGWFLRGRMVAEIRKSEELSSEENLFCSSGQGFFYAGDEFPDGDASVSELRECETSHVGGETKWEWSNFEVPASVTLILPLGLDMTLEDAAARGINLAEKFQLGTELGVRFSTTEPSAYITAFVSAVESGPLAPVTGVVLFVQRTDDGIFFQPSGFVGATF